jgi:beta-galactosidase
VPRSDATVKFSVEGPAEIIATDNGDATSFESFQSPQRKAFNGMALAIVRTKKGETGTIRVKAESNGLQAGEVIIKSRK